MFDRLMVKLREIRMYFNRIIHMQRIHMMLDIEGADISGIKAVSPTQYLVTVPTLTLGELKANFKARTKRLEETHQNPNMWMSVIDDAQAEYERRVEAGFDFNAVEYDEYTDTSYIMQGLLQRSYRVNADVEELGTDGVENAYLISFNSA